MVFKVKTLSQNQRNLIWYVAPAVLTRGSSVLLLPIYSRLLTPEEYGRVGVALVISGLLRLGILLNLENLYFRFVFGSFREIHAEEQISLGGMIRFHLGILFILLPLLCLPGHFLVARFASNIPLDFICLAIGALVLGSLQTPLSASLRAKQQIKRLSYLQLSGFVAEVSLILLGLLVFQWGAVSILVGQVFGGLILSPFFLPYFWRGIREKFVWRARGEFFRKALAFGPSTLAITGFTIVDRFLLNYFRGPSETGIYITAYQIVSLMVAGIFLFNQQWQDLTFQSRGENRRIDLSKLFLNSLNLFLYVTALLAILAEPIAQYYLGPKFRDAGRLIPLLAVIGLLRVPECFFENIGLADLNRPLLVKTNIVALGSFVVLNVILVPRFGGVGAAWAGIISLSLYLIVFYRNNLVELRGSFFQLARTSWLPLGVLGTALAGPPSLEIVLPLSMVLATCLTWRFIRYFEFLGTSCGEVVSGV